MAFIRITPNWARTSESREDEITYKSPLRVITVQPSVTETDINWCIKQNVYPYDLKCVKRRSQAKAWVKKFIVEHPGG